MCKILESNYDICQVPTSTVHWNGWNNGIYLTQVSWAKAYCDKKTTFSSSVDR
jgi:hypothetical protein